MCTKKQKYFTVKSMPIAQCKYAFIEKIWEMNNKKRSLNLDKIFEGKKTISCKKKN